MMTVLHRTRNPGRVIALWRYVRRKIFRNLSSQPHQNILSENFSELRFILIGLSPEKSLLTYLLTQKIFDICLLLESKLLANNELN